VELVEARALREALRVGATQLLLHVGVDDARRHRRHARTAGPRLLLQRQGAGEVVEPGLLRAVGGAAGHRAAAESGRHEQHAAVGAGPIRRRAQEGRGQRDRRLQADAQALREAGRVAAGDVARLAEHRGVVDQAHPTRRPMAGAGLEVGQPGAQPRRDGQRVGQVHRPLLERVARLQLGGVVARQPQHERALREVLRGDALPEAARGAGEDDEGVGHAAQALRRKVASSVPATTNRPPKLRFMMRR
jgi:hypothetical protein